MVTRKVWCIFHIVFPSHHAQENFSFVLQEVPISPAMLSDFHDPGDVQRLPFSLGYPELGSAQISLHHIIISVGAPYTL
jgi:hypothetical protein